MALSPSAEGVIGNMLNLSDFNKVGGRRGAQLLATMNYIKFVDKGANKGGLYLKLALQLTEDFKKHCGHKCNVYVSPDLSSIVLTRGDDKTVSTASMDGDKGAGVIQMNTVVEDFQIAYGEFDRVYFDSKWEQDEHGHKVVLLTANGKVDKC